MLNLNEKWLIMGILNCTPDSFSDGGRFFRANDAITHANEMLNCGAHILDIGGESTRPGAEHVDIQTEWNRIKDVITNLAEHAIISVDTYKPEVMKLALDNGAKIINNISDATINQEAFNLANEYKAKIVITHNSRSYHTANITNDCENYFAKAIKVANQYGVKNDQIILDPGIGFGKTLEQNIELMQNLDKLTSKYDNAFLLGTSKKSFIGKILNENNPQNRLAGTLSTTVIGYQKGCKIFRVHDVNENAEALKIAETIYG